MCWAMSSSDDAGSLGQQRITEAGRRTQTATCASREVAVWEGPFRRLFHLGALTF